MNAVCQPPRPTGLPSDSQDDQEHYQRHKDKRNHQADHEQHDGQEDRHTARVSRRRNAASPVAACPTARTWEPPRSGTRSGIPALPDRFADVEFAGEVTRLRSNFQNGLKRLRSGGDRAECSAIFSVTRHLPRSWGDTPVCRANALSRKFFHQPYK